MTALVWDELGARVIEHGVDRGVFYPKTAPGVCWNGLTEVDNKSTGGAPAEYYFDGTKYITVPTVEAFAATLKAFTYPEEFSEYDGISTDGNGLYFDQQIRKQFGLSYRTLVANDQDSDFGYKIHVVYNAIVSPSDRDYVTNSATPAAMEFTWDILTTPIQIVGYRPTAHLVIDSTKAPDGLVHYIEGILYGDEETDSRLPSMEELIDLSAHFDPRIVIEDVIYGLSPLDPGLGDMTGTEPDGVYKPLPGTRLTETSLPGLYVLEES